MNKYELTVCYLLEKSNNDYYNLDSLIQLKNKFNIQIILIDLNENKKLTELAKVRSKDNQNIIYITSKNKVEGYNQCKNIMEGEYVNYSSSKYLISEETIKNIIKPLKHKKANIISSKLVYVENKEMIKTVKPYIMEYDMTFKMPLFPLSINILYLKKELIKDLDFDDYYKNYCDIFFLLDIYTCENQLFFYKKSIILSDCPLENDHNLYLEQRDKDWYLTFFEDYMLHYLKNKETMSITANRAIVRLIERRIFCNYNARDKFVLDDQEVEHFYDNVKKVLSYIDDQDILNSKYDKIIPKFFAYLLLEIKYNDFNLENKILKDESNNLSLYYKDSLIGNLDMIKIDIKAINYDKHQFVFDCSLSGSHMLDMNDVKLKVLVNGNNINYQITDVYSLKKVFGKTVKKDYTFQFKIDDTDISKNIEFIYEFNQMPYKLNVSFPGAHSKINSSSRFSYWKIKNNIMTFKRKLRTIKIKKYNFLSTFVREICYLINILLRGKKLSFVRRLKLIYLRLYYWLTKSKYRNKEVWLMYDKLYKGGDNGEYFFRYCMKQNDGILPYYIINSDSPSYPELKKEFGDHIIEFNSIKNKLLTLHSTRIFSTHAGVYAFCGLSKTFLPYLKDLLNSDNYCLQHGLTIQSIAQHQNRLKDNLKMYFCASPYEISNLEHPIYGFDDNQLFLTGCPRYDGLHNNDKKQILITPTWRRNIVITGNKMGSSKSYNAQFKNTEYFQIYNSLINDKRLIDCAKKNNYKIIFLLHPVISSQIKDFNCDDSVEIIAATSNMSYEKILTESSLMVTDYSGVQFDFAYQRKPIIYYHPEELPPQYEESRFKYESMGFGPICVTHEQIVTSLCQLIDNQCHMDDEYIKRVNHFFEYDDFNNCKRIYDLVINKTKEL